MHMHAHAVRDVLCLISHLTYKKYMLNFYLFDKKKCILQCLTKCAINICLLLQTNNPKHPRGDVIWVLHACETVLQHDSML